MMDKMAQFQGLNKDTASNFGIKKDIVSDLGLVEKVKIERKKTTITISMNNYKKLISLSVKTGETISDVVDKALNLALKDIQINEEYVEAFNNNDDRRNKVETTRKKIKKDK